MILIIISLIVVFLSTALTYHYLVRKKAKRIPLSQLRNNEKIIWSYWHDTNYPVPVQMAYYSWQISNPKYTICNVNPDNLGHYLKDAIFPKNFKDLSHQHKADCIRLMLLEKYGGVWLDSTIYVFRDLNKVWDNQYDIGGYYQDWFTIDQNNPVIENWFISAPYGSRLIRDWKQEYFYALKFEDRTQYLDRIESQGINLQNINDKEYLLQHCCFLVVIHRNKYKIKVLSANNSNGPYGYLVKYNFDSKKAIEHLIHDSMYPIPLMIKLRKHEREILLRDIHSISKQSALYPFLKSKY